MKGHGTQILPQERMCENLVFFLVVPSFLNEFRCLSLGAFIQLIWNHFHGFRGPYLTPPTLRADTDADLCYSPGTWGS